MSKSITLICAFASMAFVAACGGQQEEEVVFIEDPAPIVAEPVYNKY